VVGSNGEKRFVVAYVVERTSPECLTLRHKPIAAGWSQRYLLISDVHFDSPYCDRALLTKLLDQAKACNAGVLDFGDWFDAMQGKNDRRGSKQDVRPEYKVADYFGALIDYSADYLAGYTDVLIAMGDGNHNTSILRHNEIDLLRLLCGRLGIQHMGYSGFIRFMFQGTKGMRTTKRLYFTHGSNGGGPVTKGVIQTNRRAANIDADIFVSGDIHESWAVENVVVKMSDSGRVFLAPQIHVQLPTFKQEYHMGGGYHIEKGRPPKPLGGYWLEFYYDGSVAGNVGCRVERAN
jgi:hypothetical protein